MSEQHRSFHQIVSIDQVSLRPWAAAELSQYSEVPPVLASDIPADHAEIIRRIGTADCALVSWNTRVPREVIEACPNLRYIGMCCSLYDAASANVDIAAAHAHGIDVRGIRDYGDTGLIEFILSDLIRLVKGLGPCQWRDEPCEIAGKTLGIIGLGTTGRLLADAASALGVHILYYSRTRKEAAEAKGYAYHTLPELLKEADFISVHLPRNTVLLHEAEFETFGPGKVLINTSLGTPFDVPALQKWLDKPGTYAIFDKDGAGPHRAEFEDRGNVLIASKVAGMTAEAKERLSEKVLQNMKDHLAEK